MYTYMSKGLSGCVPKCLEVDFGSTANKLIRQQLQLSESPSSHKFWFVSVTYTPSGLLPRCIKIWRLCRFEYCIYRSPRVPYAFELISPFDFYSLSLDQPPGDLIKAWNNQHRLGFHQST